MLSKTKTAIQKLLPNLRDVRFLGFVVFVSLVLLTTWSGVRIIETNYKLQQEIAELTEKNKITQLENDNLRLENEYYNSDTYLELTARRQFGKGAPGEKLVLVPSEVALKHVPELKSAAHKEAQQNDDRPWYRQNFDAWFDFILHRG